MIGHSLSHLPGLDRVPSETSGSYSRPSVVDGVMRLFVWRNSGSPLIVQVGKPWASILSLWRAEATRIAGVVTALILFVL